MGDRVYIYLAAPYKQIAYMTEVLDVGLELDLIIERIKPYFLEAGEPSKRDKQPKPFMKLKTLRTIPLDKHSPLGLSCLKDNGLKGMLMGARKLENNPGLLSYIQAIVCIH